MQKKKEFRICDQIQWVYLARILELCACHTEGILILQKHLSEVMRVINLFMKFDSKDNKDVTLVHHLKVGDC